MQRERKRERAAEREAGSIQGASRGTQSRVSRIMLWAEGGAKPLSHRGCPVLPLKSVVFPPSAFYDFSLFLTAHTLSRLFYLTIFMHLHS